MKDFPTTGWATVALSDVAKVVNGGTPKSKVAEYWGGDVQWLTPKDMGQMDGREISETPRTITEAGLSGSSARLVPAGSVILSTRAPIGHLAMNTVPMAFNQGCRGIIPSEKLDPTYLYHFLDMSRDLLNELGSGTTFKELSATNLKSVKIPLPPLEEQQQIVAVLDKAFEGLARARVHAETNLQNVQELSEASVDAIFERLPDATPINELQDFCTERGITYGVIKLGEHKPDGVPCLRTSNVKPLHIDTEGMKWIAPELSDEYRRTILEGGEVLVNVRGTLGGVATVPEDMVGWNISREVAMVPVDHTRLDPDFASFFISTRKAQNWLTGVVKGAAYKGINLTDLRLLKIPAPTLEVQIEVIEEVKELRQRMISAEAAYKEKLSNLDDLRQSLLQKAFAGELT